MTSDDDLTERITGAAIEVHRQLGPGLLESIYEEALCIELKLQGISFERQVEIDMSSCNFLKLDECLQLTIV